MHTLSTATTMMRVLLLSMLVGTWSCAAFSSIGPSHVTRRLAIDIAIFAAASDDDTAAERVSRRDAITRAALTVGAATVFAPGYAEAYGEKYQAPLDEQVKAIENANYMGNFMNKIYEPNSDGDPSKHLPQVEVSGNDVTVSVPHVMIAEHYIKFIWLKDVKSNDVVVVKGLPPTDPSPPTLQVRVPSGVELRPYIFCNLHGLWKGEEFKVA